MRSLFLAVAILALANAQIDIDCFDYDPLVNEKVDEANRIGFKFGEEMLILPEQACYIETFGDVLIRYFSNDLEIRYWRMKEDDNENCA